MESEDAVESSRMIFGVLPVVRSTDLSEGDKQKDLQAEVTNAALSHVLSFLPE